MADFSKYTGEFQNDTYHGKGELVTTEYTYTGTFMKGEVTGKDFTEASYDGSTFYTGHLKTGTKHGIGIYKTSEFKKTGFWDNDKLHGKDCKIEYYD